MCGRDNGKSKESVMKVYSPEMKLEKQKGVSKVMDVGVLQKGMRDCFIKALVELDEQKKKRTCKKKKRKGWNCSDLYLIYFQALSARAASSGRTAQRASTFGLI